MFELCVRINNMLLIMVKTIEWQINRHHWTDGRKEGWMARWIDGWMDRGMGGWINEWMNRWMDRRNQWMDRRKLWRTDGRTKEPEDHRQTSVIYRWINERKHYRRLATDGRTISTSKRSFLSWFAEIEDNKSAIRLKLLPRHRYSVMADDVVTWSVRSRRHLATDLWHRVVWLGDFLSKWD